MRTSTYGPGYSATVPTENAQIYVPERPHDCGRGVVYCHGASQVSGDLIDTGVIQAWNFADAGMPFAIPDLGGGATWGNDTAQARFTDAWNALIAKGARSDKVLVYGGSMGSLNALAWCMNNPTKVAACAVNLPIVDLADVHDNNRNSYAAAIETAYTNLAGYTAAVGTHNPNANRNLFGSFPLGLWGSSDDPIGLPSLASDFATAVGARYVTYGAVGHTLTGFVPGDVLEFLRQYA